MFDVHFDLCVYTVLCLWIMYASRVVNAQVFVFSTDVSITVLFLLTRWIKTTTSGICIIFICVFSAGYRHESVVFWATSLECHLWSEGT